MSRWHSVIRLALGGLLLWLGTGRLFPDPEAPASNPILQAWLTSAGNLTTFQATVVQTRQLQAIRHPLVSTGEVWFAAPGRFRWEMGRPPQSVALRNPEELLVLSPRLHRAERYPQGADAAGPEKELMSLLDVGFPRDAAEFRSRFELVEVSTNAGVVRLRLRPRAAAARRLMPELTVVVDPGLSLLRATEMTFADGSRMQNEFHSVVTNRPMADGLFRTNLDASWSISGKGVAR